MDERPPWDGLRAAFYLVAFMIAYQALLVGATAVWCVYTATDLILAGKFECNKDSRLTDLLQACVTTALAFGMAFLNRGKDK